MSRTKLLLATALACAPLAALADQPIIVTATEIPTPAAQVPADVTVFTAQELAARGDTTLAQALEGLPGANFVQSGGPGNAASLFLRGTDSEDVLVLLDGVPVNDPASANGAFNFGAFPLADVERIEIVRGPMSGLYGSNAIGGVVNIITKQGGPRTEASLTLAGGWPAQGQGSATLSGTAGKLDYAFSGALDEEAGFDATPQRMTSVYTGQHDPYRGKLGAAQLGYSFTPEIRAYAIVRAQATDAAFPDLDNPEFDSPADDDDTRSLLTKLGLAASLMDGRWHTDLSVAQLSTRLNNKQLLEPADPNEDSADDVYQGRRNIAQWDNTWHLPDAAALNSSALTFGAAYSDDFARENVDESSYGYPFTETVRASQHEWAGHLGGQTTVANRLTLTAALRDDGVSSFGNALTWRLGGVWSVPEADLHLKASAGTGFLAPSLFDLHYVDNYGDSGNPNLRPERSIGWEAGPEFSLPGVDLSATYFRSTIRDLIQSELITPAYIYEEENIGEADINGVEAEIALHPAPWLRADFSYTYTRATSGDNGSALLRRPQNTGAVSATITPLPALSITPDVRYIGRFTDYLYNDGGIETGIGSSDPGTIADLSAAYRLNATLSLFAAGKNILNSRFEAANGLQIPGASLLLGVRAALQ